jgi:glycosyltransferase involved in cell wall biosynthesis
MKERITVLMPVYNGAKYLRETIENVLSQTFRDFVFMIINDGSTDETEQIIQSYPDERIKYLNNEANLGLVKTLNKGIELVETEFLARMDADDLWVETKLEKQIEVLDRRPEIGICGTSIRKFGTYEANFIFPQNNEELKVGFLFYCCMSHPSVVFRMSFLRNTGLRYRPDYFPAEDYKMWVDALSLTQIYNIPEILVFYRQHDSQITQDSNTSQSLMTDRVRLELINELSDNFSNEELSFHVNVFLNGEIENNSDYFAAKNWADKLIVTNERRQLFNQKLFRQKLNIQVQSSYYLYIKRKYFRENKAFITYLFSCDWSRLNLKYNFKLLLKK